MKCLQVVTLLSLLMLGCSRVEQQSLPIYTGKTREVSIEVLDSPINPKVPSKRKISLLIPATYAPTGFVHAIGGQTYSSAEVKRLHLVAWRKDELNKLDREDTDQKVSGSFRWEPRPDVIVRFRTRHGAGVMVSHSYPNAGLAGEIIYLGESFSFQASLYTKDGTGPLPRRVLEELASCISESEPSINSIKPR